ncbi:MAG TPA: ASCH domain-containing protein, partial [Pricia sp.]|nr:ASCH domain-containing protein [Pricia sp.]
MKTLHLNLKKKWFDMILSGEKKEEYREIKEYWIGRLIRFLWVNDMVGISYLGRLRSGNYDKISF